MFKKKLYLISIITLILSINILSFVYATDEGYGEDSDSLGQFTDSFEDSSYISNNVNVVRNIKLELMELNGSIGISYGSYENNVQITIESNMINSNLTNFPVLIRISDSSGINDDNITGIFDVVGNSYQKIAITDITCLNEYYVDVEQWSLTDRLGALWISVNVSSLEDIKLYLHYGSAVSNNTGYVDVSGSLIAQNVWDQYYVAVYHMSDQTTSTILDSTDSDLDGTKQGANQPEEVNGLIGLAQDHENEEITLDNFGSTYWNVTAEAFFYPHDTDAIHSIFSVGEPDNSIDRVHMDVNSDFLYNYYRTDGVTVNPSIAFNAENRWSYFVTNRELTSTKGYMNGTNDVGWDGVVGLGSIQDLRQCWIGSFSAGGSNQFDGLIEEVRFSNIRRTDDWINASSFVLFDDIVDYGSLLESGGYEEEGYFTTTEYMISLNGSSLALLVNSSIPANTIITLEFSSDNSTWVNDENVTGYNSLEDGFQCFDMRELNFTSVYLRFNFTTTDNSITSRLYQVRIISTIGEAVNGVGEPSEDYAGLLIVGLILGLVLGIGVSRS